MAPLWFVLFCASLIDWTVNWRSEVLLWKGKIIYGTMKILQSLPRLISSPPSSRKWQKINKKGWERRGISRSLSPSFVQNFFPFRGGGKKLLSAHLFLPLAPLFATHAAVLLGGDLWLPPFLQLHSLVCEVCWAKRQIQYNAICFSRLFNRILLHPPKKWHKTLLDKVLF